MDEAGGRPGRGRPKRRARRIVLLLVPLGLLVGAVLVARHLWRGVGDTAIGSGGLAILVAGGGVTLALGVGLIALMILSDRRGYDEVGGGGGDRPRRRLFGGRRPAIPEGPARDSGAPPRA